MTPALLVLIIGVVFGVLCWIPSACYAREQARIARRHELAALEAWYDEQYAGDSLDIYALDL